MEINRVMQTSVNENELVEIIHKQLGTALTIKIKIPEGMAKTIDEKHDEDMEFNGFEVMQYALARALGHNGEKEEAKQFIEDRGYIVLEYDYMLGVLNIGFSQPKK